MIPNSFISKRCDFQIGGNPIAGNFIVTKTPAKNTNLGDKSLENQRVDPWKERKYFFKKVLRFEQQ